MQDRNDKNTGYSGIERRTAQPVTKSLAPLTPPAMDKSIGRHSAIRSKLPTLATYRTWSAKARTDWEEKG